MIFHITPINEKHTQSEICPCNPDIYHANGHTVITHNSFFDEEYHIEHKQYSEDYTPTFQEDPNATLDLKESFLLDPDNINLN